MIEAVVVMTTTNTEREARELAGILVEEHAAACVQIVPKIQSIYKWEGETRSDQEYLILIKTQEKRLKDVKAIIKKHHSYEVPELVALPVVDGADDYFAWMKETTK